VTGEPAAAADRVEPYRPYFMTSQRIGFGEWADGDDGLAEAIWGDPEVTKLTGGPFSAEQVHARLASEIANLRRAGIQYWPIFRLDTGEPLGCCGLRPREAETGVFELGYQLRREAWGQGYASEAARTVVAWAAANGVPALIAGHHPENHASKRTLQRLGFAYTHDELYPPTGLMEPCYRLQLAEPN